MTDYIIVPDSSIDGDSVTDSALFTALRDRAIAIGEGDMTVPATARRGRHALIHIREEQSSGTNGGTFTSGAWQTRVLNTKVSDTGGNATLASNQITLVAGTYEFNARCPGLGVDEHKCRLQNITDGTTIAVGSSEYVYFFPDPPLYSDSVVSGMFTLSSSKVIELQHRCATTKVTTGFGLACGFGVAEIYSEITLKRLL